MRHEDLMIDTSEFTPLLEANLITEMQNQYVTLRFIDDLTN